jgi:hypothetical protein
MLYVLCLFIGALIGACGVLGLLCFASGSAAEYRRHLAHRGEPASWG